MQLSMKSTGTSYIDFNADYVVLKNIHAVLPFSSQIICKT